MGWDRSLYFRNDFEAADYAEQAKPFEAAHGPLDLSYARAYGARAADAATKCREASARSDQRALHLAMHSLSIHLYRERRDLFAEPGRKGRAA